MSTFTPDLEHDSADLARRARAWARTRDPRTLWPRLEPQMLRPSADAIGRAVAAILRGHRATLGAADSHDAYAIGIAALLTGTGPLLGSWVERGSLDVGDGLAGILEQHLVQGRARAQRIMHGMTAPLARLAAAGVTPVVIKGLHTAHEYFAEPGQRPMSDVDLIVAPAQIRAAEAALREAGFTPSPLVARPYKRNWYPPDDEERLWSFEVFDARDRWQIELHDGPNFGYLDDARFRIGVRPVTGWQFQGTAVRVAAQPTLAVLLAAHLAADLHIRRLLRLVELILVIRRDRERRLLDWDALAAMLDESGSWPFTYPAFALAERLAPGTVDATILARGRRASTRLTRFVTDRFNPSYPVLEDTLVAAVRLMWVRSAGDLARFTVRWLNPYPGRPWREIAEFCYSRVRKLLSIHGT